MPGRYWLGIDVGTTFTAAAVRREGRTEVVQLGSRGAAIPSVLLLRDDGELLTGDTARRRAVSEPDRVATEFKRRVGDPVPVLVGGSPFAAEALVARLLRWVVDTVVEREGGRPEGIAVTHPANWGPYKLDLLTNAIRTAGLDAVTLLSEPAAAAQHYAAQARVPDGATVAVYDLGGGTFDACVLRKRPDGSFELLGQPEGIERLGGIDLDQAVLGHVQRAADDLFAGIDPDDPSTRAALAHLRDECTAAKEQLSSDVDAVIPVLIPGRPGRDVRITRAEFEGLVRPVLTDTIGCVERSLRSAGVTAEQLHAVLLVGGSSRVPLVAQLVAAGLGRPVAVDADPKLAVAQGAALAAEAAFPAREVAAAPIAAPAPPAPAEDGPTVPLEPAGTGRRRPPVLVISAVVVVLAAVIGGYFALSGGGDDGGGDAASSGGPLPTTTTTTGAPAFEFPSTDFVHITDVQRIDGVFHIAFDTNFAMSGAEDGFAAPGHHIHFFYGDDVRAQAGTNGQPTSCNCWLAYGGDSPVGDPFFTITDAPPGATEICALVATPMGVADVPPHQIADVTGDGVPDPDSGDCFPLPDG